MSDAQAPPIYPAQSNGSAPGGEVNAPTRHEGSKVRAAKVGHKKSRRGCLKCKARRVKCDEVTPECGNCRRLGLDCSYTSEFVVHKPATAKPKILPQTTGLPSPSDSSSTVILSHPNDGEPQGVQGQLPETRERRLLELRLQQHWLLRLCPLLAQTVQPNMREQWQNLHHMAMLSDGMLNAMLALTATHMLVTLGHDLTLAKSRNQYLALGLGHLQSRAGQLTPNNATGIALNALLVYYNALYMLTERPELSDGPYKAPIDFFQMSKIAASVAYSAAQVRARNSPLGQNRIEMVLAAEGPPERTWREMREVPGICEIFEPILLHQSASDQTWVGSNKRTYETALAYIAAIYAAIIGGGTIYMQAGDIQAFSINVPQEFLRLVEEGASRAIAMMAYYFAVLSSSKLIRHIDEGGALRKMLRAEVCAAAASLGDEWGMLMVWPVRESGRSGRGESGASEDWIEGGMPG